MRKFFEHPIVSGIVAGLVVYWVPLTLNLFPMTAPLIMTLYILGGIGAAYFFTWLFNKYKKDKAAEKEYVQTQVRQLEEQRRIDQAQVNRQLTEIRTKINELAPRQ